MKRTYQRCTRCVLDTSDKNISFDADGVCNHCHHFDKYFAPIVFADENVRTQKLNEVIAKIKNSGKGKPYDCLIGLSGGVDSSYVAYLACKHGLRPLALHVDAGWNSELAVNNIQNIVNKLGIDLKTFVVDWEEMRDLQLSFFKAGVANCDIPQDHAFVAAVYKTAIQENIKTILNGVNLATEATTGFDWGGYAFTDLSHIIAIQKQFGKKPLKQYPMFTQFEWRITYPFIKRIQSVSLLNLVSYDKNKAKSILKDELGWRDYGGKHYESILTKFLQQYYFIKKCGFDKRLIHLTDLIHSHQITREDALQELESEAWRDKDVAADLGYIAKKLGISAEEFSKIIEQPLIPHAAYTTSLSLDRNIAKIQKWVGVIVPKK